MYMCPGLDTVYEFQISLLLYSNNPYLSRVGVTKSGLTESDLMSQEQHSLLGISILGHNFEH